MNPDIALTFDPSSFIQGVQKMTESMTGFEKKGTQTEKKTQSSMNSLGSMAVAKGMIIAQVLTGAFRKGMAQIPEIGKTFSIAGDIISRNLLWPLRKELIPVLQSLLNWVRDNRAMFVRFGSVIANVFRAIKQIVITFYEMFSKIFKQMAGGLEKMFGKTTMTITQIMNLVLFKIVAVAMFLQMILEPVFEWLVDKILMVIGWVQKFGEGFMETIGDIEPYIADMRDSINQLWTTIGLGEGQVSSIGDAFKTFGQIIGLLVVPVFYILAETIESISLGLQLAYLSAKALAQGMSGDFEGALKTAKEMKDAVASSSERSSQRFERTKSSVATSAQQIMSPKERPDPRDSEAVGTSIAKAMAKVQVAGQSISKGSVQTNNSNIVLNIELPKDKINPLDYADAISKQMTKLMKDEQLKRGQR